MNSNVAKHNSPKNLVAIGSVIRLHGFRGELVIHSDSGKESSLSYLDTLWIGQSPETAEVYSVEEAAWMPKGWKVRLAEVRDESTAKALKGLEIYTAREALSPTGDNEYYLSDLEGAALVDGVSGQEVGVFAGVDNPTSPSRASGGNSTDRWWFHFEDRLIAVPAQKRFIATVDVTKKRIVVNHLDELV